MGDVVVSSCWISFCFWSRFFFCFFLLFSVKFSFFRLAISVPFALVAFDDRLLQKMKKREPSNYLALHKQNRLSNWNYIPVFLLVTSGLVRVLALILSMVCCWLFTSSPMQKLLLVNDQSAREHGCGNGIRVIVWDNEAPFAEEVASLGAPVVIKNTSVLQWNALKRWSLEYLESRVQHLDNVKHGNRSCFVAVNEKFNQLDPEVEIERHDHFRTENMTMQEFAQFVRNGSLQQSYVYYSGEMSKWGTVLEKDISPTEFLKLDSTGLASAVVWMGQENVTAQTHYDKSYNFFVQIVGRKHWTLYSPLQWKSLYPHPSLHPHYRQAQVMAEKPDTIRFPNYVSQRT